MSTHTDREAIAVETKFGHVTLGGTTESEHARQLAERIATGIPGVESVTNGMKVRADATAATTAAENARTGFEASSSTIGTSTPTVAATDNTASDSAITTSVRTSLDSLTTLDSAGIGISAKDGVVRLVGTIASDTQKATAEQLARDVAGVREVDASGLTIRESALAESEDEDE